MEQWHQKLHNNTTPDDIVICEAFLAFLEANGDQNQYDATLKAGGVTKKRLESLERPINTRPEWHPHLKDGLIHDFNQHLILLKSVHSGTDLATAINAGNHFVSHEVRESLYWIQEHFDNPHSSVLDLVKNTTWARHQIGLQLSDEARPELVKELLYLDLALEQTIRTVIERASLPDLDGDQLFELIEAAAHNLNADKPYEEINQCLHEWIRLPNEDRFSSEWALHAKAALDRLRRAVEADIDDDYQLLQSKAEWLGKEIDADKWVVTLFSEELVRGRSVFLLSMLIHHFDPVLRRQANLGDWQVISPSNAIGKVQEVESLRTIQGKQFKNPTIIVADKVYGDEEPPKGVTAVITPSSVDLVSHVAVRARNNHLLFATCYERNTFDNLKAESGKVLSLSLIHI